MMNRREVIGAALGSLGVACIPASQAKARPEFVRVRMIKYREITCWEKRGGVYFVWVDGRHYECSHDDWLRSYSQRESQAGKMMFVVEPKTEL